MDTPSLSLSDPARIRWQCRRGMLELDIMLLSFFDKVYETLSVEQKISFVELLTFPDQVLYSWLIGQTQPETAPLQALVQIIRAQQYTATK